MAESWEQRDAAAPAEHHGVGVGDKPAAKIPALIPAERLDEVFMRMTGTSLAVILQQRQTDGAGGY